MITIDNYFEATQGVFHIIPDDWVEKLIKHFKIHVPADCCNKSVVTHQDDIVLDGRLWKKNFVSYSLKFKSTSAYWVSEDGQYLLRVSDHWSKASGGISQCGWIKDCWWELAGQEQFGIDGFYGGIIKFRDLSEAVRTQGQKW